MPRRGFTLIESLTAFAVGLLILGAIFGIFSASRSALNAGGNRAELVQNGRIGFERLSRELRQAQAFVTALPETDTVPDNPPPALFEFQDGHDPSTLTYIRYHLSGTTLLREVAYYAFPDAPETRVVFTSRDALGNAPTKTVVEDVAIAEGFERLQFWGSRLITVSATLRNGEVVFPLQTTLYARNIAGSGD